MDEQPADVREKMEHYLTRLTLFLSSKDRGEQVKHWAPYTSIFREGINEIDRLKAELTRVTAEWQPIIERAAKIIGSDYRNNGVVSAAMDYLLAELDRVKIEAERLWQRVHRQDHP